MALDTRFPAGMTTPAKIVYNDESSSVGINANIYSPQSLSFVVNKGEIELSKQELNHPQKSGGKNHDEVSVAISESSLLVPLAISKKLAALRKQSQAQQTIEKNPMQRNEIPTSGLNKEANALLKAAREQIDAKIAELMASYPPSKKNKMFALRYGSPERIKQMAMKAIFTHLGLVKPKKFTLIESLDYFGNDTPSKKAGSSQ
jgi:hypothetical protein